MLVYFLSISFGHYGNVLLCIVFVLVVALWFFVHWFLSVCLLTFVDQVVELIGRVMCLNVVIVSSSHHGCNAKHVPSLVLSLFLYCVLFDPMDHAFEPVRKVVVRLIISVMVHTAVIMMPSIKHSLMLYLTH